MGRLLHRLRSMDSSHRRIAGGMAWVSFFLILGRGIGAIKEMAFAWRFGAGAAADAYTFIFFILSYSLGFLVSVYSTALIPVLKRSRPEECAVFRSELLGMSLLLGVLAAAMTGACLYALIEWMSLGLSTEAVRLARPAIWIMSLMVLPGFLNALFSAWILEKGKHANTLLEAVPSFFILTGLLLFSGHSIIPLAIVTTAGFLFQSLYLGFLIWRDDGLEKARFTTGSPLWNRFFNTAAVIAASQGFFMLVPLIDTFFSASIGSDGSVATLGFANRFLAILIGIGGTAINRSAISVFSDEGMKAARVRQISHRWLLILIGAGVVTALLFWIFSPLIIQMALERGAFTAENTVIVSDLFRIGLLQLPFYWAALLLYTELASQGRHRPIILATGLALSVKLILTAVLREPMGLYGIQLASVAAQVLLFSGFYAASYLAWENPS